MLSLIQKYYHTLKHLQWIQVKYRLVYLLFKPSIGNQKMQLEVEQSEANSPLKLLPSIFSSTSFLETDRFQFLNIEQYFDQGIDWNFSLYGKLWTYNLNYFEFLSQPNISKYEGLGLIHDFINKEKNIKDGMEPFPISLRAIFWIKFLLKHRVNDETIHQSLFRQLQILSVRPEFHLMGNHLLENGFSLLFGGCYFKNKKLLKQAEKILSEQLDEQILPDGAHFELSPMYHQIMLFRILDCINLLQQNPIFDLLHLAQQLQEKASRMLGWMQEMRFQNGQLPRLNDSTNGIAPEPQELIDYARRLGIKTQGIGLKECGYRKIKKTDYELLIDVGQIGPDYIPGHAHSDTFNFVLHHFGKPFIVDTGISTYEKNQKRNQERSTSAHNTVAIAGEEQSEIWGGFRVARRAKVVKLQELPNQISAAHNGYHRIDTIHQRTFKFEDDSVTIIDEISNQNNAEAFLHFHPDVEVYLIGQEIQTNLGKITFENLKSIKLAPFEWALGFNKTKPSKKVILNFNERLCTKIYTP